MIFYEGVLRDFQKEKIKYVLVRGIALNLLGVERSTHDMDILVKMTDKNLAKVVTVLKKRGYKIKQPVDPMGIADKKTREDWIKNKSMKAFSFYKDDDYREVDIIIESPVSFEKAEKTAKIFRTDGIKIKVISAGNLIKMKDSTGRERDKEDTTKLKEVKRIKKR